MATKPEILDAALGVLRAGEALTIDAVARAAGLTKPGVVHHFSTKEGLTLAVLDHLMDRWEEQLRDGCADAASGTSRLRAYVVYTLTSEMDPADLALLADPRLRDKLADRWAQRMDPWLGATDDPHATAARLLADGAWINRSLGMLELDPDHRDRVVTVALSLIDQGATSS